MIELLNKKSKKKSLIYPLEWNFNFNIAEVFDDIQDINLILKEMIKDYPHEKERRFYKKLKNWNDQIDKILDNFHEIQDILINSIEKRLYIKFRDKNLFLIALFTRTTKNLFLEMKQESSLRNNYPNIFTNQILGRLINLSEMAEGFATLGDAVLDLLAGHRAWEKGLYKKGIITDEMNELKRNSILAQICDDLKLDEYKISVVPEIKTALQETVDHRKATFFEAIIWVYYSENGFEKVLSLFKKI